MLQFTDKGIYCPAGDFYIDPWRGVDRAVITHGHSDHARWGSRLYLAHPLTEPILHLRLGADVTVQTAEFGEPVTVNGVRISFHPAGHIIGSAQVRVEHKGEVWVVSGDYKTEDDGISGAFEPVPCHAFISECTFGLPVYRWKTQAEIFADINGWWRTNAENGKASVLIGYSLGKAQRIVAHLDYSIGPVFAHGATFNVNEHLRPIVPALPFIPRVTADLPKDRFRGALILAPQSAVGTPWLRRFEPYSLGICSGWCQLRGNVRRRNADFGFALSDHADWDGLLAAIAATGAERIFATHGYTAVFARYLREIGYEADEVRTEYGGELVEEVEAEKS
jgi:putative mRNA 3-end processing factor